MRNLLEMFVNEFKKYEELENTNGNAGNIENARYYMSKKWEVMKEAEKRGMDNDLRKALN